MVASNHSMQGTGAIHAKKSRTDRTGVIIDDVAWIGCNAVLLPGVCIGQGAVVGAGSVVTRSIPSMAVAVGNPAKVIKMRGEG